MEKDDNDCAGGIIDGDYDAADDEVVVVIIITNNNNNFEYLSRITLQCKELYGALQIGLDWESILRREETGVPGEDPRSQVEID